MIPPVCRYISIVRLPSASSASSAVHCFLCVLCVLCVLRGSSCLPTQQMEWSLTPLNADPSDDPVPHDRIARVHDLVRPYEASDPISARSNCLHDFPEYVAYLGHLLTGDELVTDANAEAKQAGTRSSHDLPVARAQPRARHGWRAVDHAKISHDIRHAIDVHADVSFLQRTVPARLGEDRDDTASRRGVCDAVRERRNLSVGVCERNQLRGIESRQCLALLVELRLAGKGVTGEREQHFPDVT